MRDAFASELFKLAKSNKDVIFITADLGFGVFDEFAKKLPKQYINVGVAEQNMIGLATGLGLEGKKVFVYSIGNFVSFRCLEQIRNDAAYHEIDLTIVCSGGGFNYGPLGMSHHTTEDIAIMRAIPNITVVVPSTAWEAKHATKKLGKLKGISYLRIEKGGENKPPFKNTKFKIGKHIVHRHGKDVCIITAGSIINECINAANELKKIDVSCKIISMPTIKPIDEKIIIETARKFKNIITVEEHNRIGGLGGAVAEVLVKSKSITNFESIAIKDTFSSIVGDQKYLRKEYKIDTKSIIRTVKKIIHS